MYTFRFEHKRLCIFFCVHSVYVLCVISYYKQHLVSLHDIHLLAFVT